MRTVTEQPAQMNKPVGMVEIAFDDLGRYSHWPRRLLGLEPFAVRSKTEREVQRQYQDEEWAKLLAYARTLERPTLADIERHHVPHDVMLPYYEMGKFYLATERGRNTRSNLKVGICGEHGGEPQSVEFCYKTGLNYVSCSPFRVLTARLAAAQAAATDKLKVEGGRTK